MNLSSSSGELSGALKNLRVLWEETKTVWNDPVRQDFEENEWKPIEANVVAALRAMDRLGAILYKMQQEVGDRALQL